MKRYGLLALLAALLLMPLAFTSAQNSDDLNTALADGVQKVTVGDLLLDDHFDIKDDWENYTTDNTSAEVTDGEYIIKADGAYFNWGLNEKAKHADAVLEVDATQTDKSQENFFGLVCRANKDGEGYYFIVGSDGYFRIAKREKKEFTSLVDWSYTTAVLAGKTTNHLAAICAGDYLALYANGELLAEANDSTFSEGIAGLTAGAYEKTKVSATFDDLKLWEVKAVEEDPAATLTDYAGKPQAAVAELQKLGVIPKGGKVLFNENKAFFSGQGNFFTPLARKSPFTDIVMAGTISYTAGNTEKYELCSLMSRIGKADAKGTVNVFVDVGFTSGGSLRIADNSAEGKDPTTVRSLALNMDYSESHHLLIVIIKNKLTVYLDGKRTVSNAPVVSRAGTYGIGLIGRGAKASCEGQNVWVYSIK
jgi:hypothetical protein